MNIKPLGERVLVKPAASEEVTKSGIFIPDTAKEKPSQGEVVAVGPGRLLEDGSRAEIEVKIGDTVLYAKYGGTEFKYDGQDFMVLSADRDILAIIG